MIMTLRDAEAKQTDAKNYILSLIGNTISSKYYASRNSFEQTKKSLLCIGFSMFHLRPIPSKQLDKISLPTSQLDTLAKEIQQTQDIKIEDQMFPFSKITFQYDDQGLPSLQLQEQSLEQQEKPLIGEIKELLRNYVKSGQSLLMSIRQYTANKNKQASLPAQTSQPMTQQSYFDSFKLKTQEHFGDIQLEEEQSSFYQNNRKEQNKEIKSIPNHKSRRDYGYLPDKQLNLNFDKRTLSNNGQEDEYKKKYQILSPEQIRQLRKDLGTKQFTKAELLNKYRISHSTLLRYVQRFNQLPESVTWSKKRKPNNYATQNSSNTGRSRKTRYPQSQLEPQQDVNSQMYPQNETHSQMSKVSNSRIQGNSMNNLHTRYLFMKELRKLDLNRVIFIDELCYWKLTSQVSDSRGTFLHPEYGNLKAIHFVIAISDSYIMHWKLKPTKLTSQQFLIFFSQIVQKAKDYTFIMDNHSIHKTDQIKHKIQTEGVKVCYLPPCSKQMNPLTFFYEDFKRRLYPRLKSSFSMRKLLEITSKMIQVIHEKGKQSNREGYFSKCHDFWRMAEKKQMFPNI